MASNCLWLDAFYEQCSQLRSSYGFVILALDDLVNDADHRLAVLLAEPKSRVRIYQGLNLQCEISVPELACFMCTFHMNSSLPG